MATENNNRIGATVVYDSQHALDAAKAYEEKIRGQLGHYLASRPYSATEQKRNLAALKLSEAALGKASLPKNYETSLPTGTIKSNDWLGDFYARNNIGGVGGNLDQEARDYWGKEAAKKGIYETKKVIEGTAKNEGTWGQSTPAANGIRTDNFLNRSGGSYQGWHKKNPVNMDASLDDDSWVRGAYQSLLGREADEEGLNYWKGALAGGQSRGDVVSNIKRGSEYKDKFLSDAYMNLFDREVDTGGLEYWSNQMQQGQSEDSIISNLKRSDEYGRHQQNLMRNALSQKDSLDIMNDVYDDQIAMYGRDYQNAQDAVQKLYGTSQDYAPLLTTDPNSPIYTQDPEASNLASINYLASRDPSEGSPSIWAQALRDAGANALANIDIPGLVEGFFDTRKNKGTQTFLDSEAARLASDW